MGLNIVDINSFTQRLQTFFRFLWRLYVVQRFYIFERFLHGLKPIRKDKGPVG